MQNTDVVLITGASTGIGRALALEFARHGHSLLLVARRKDKLEETRRAVEALALALPVSVFLYPADLTLPDTAEQIRTFCDNERLSPVCLINNAGMGAEGDFTQIPWARQQQIIELNILALTRMCAAFLPEMRQRKSGCVVNISSTTAFMPLASEAVYAASKAYVLSFSQALHEENRKYGVTVCTICPGVTDTEFFASADFTLSRFHAADPADFARFAYNAVQHRRPLAVHRFSNRLIALWARLFPRGSVRRISAKMCQ